MIVIIEHSSTSCLTPSRAWYAGLIAVYPSSGGWVCLVSRDCLNCSLSPSSLKPASLVNQISPRDKCSETPRSHISAHSCATRGSNTKPCFTKISTPHRAKFLEFIQSLGHVFKRSFHSTALATSSLRTRRQVTYTLKIT